MGKRPAAPCLHTVTPVVCVLLSCAFLLQGTNELMRYVSCWENMTNQGSEYVGRNVPKHEVYIQGNCLLSQKSALQHLLGLEFLFFCTDFSCFIYTALKDLLRSSPLFFLIYFFCFFKYQTAWEKKSRIEGILWIKGVRPKRNVLNKKSDFFFNMENYTWPLLMFRLIPECQSWRPKSRKNAAIQV